MSVRSAVEKGQKLLKDSLSRLGAADSSDALEEEKRRKNMAVGITGMVTAVMILILFVLTATFLRSVFLGLVIAFLLFPIQSFFYKYFFSRSIYRPILLLCHRWQGWFVSSKPSTDPALDLKLTAAAHSAVFTFILTLVGGMLLIAGGTFYTTGYLHDKTLEARGRIDAVVAEERSYHGGTDSDLLRSSYYFSELVSGVARRIERIGERFENPSVHDFFHQAGEYVREPQNRQKVGTYLAERIHALGPRLMNLATSSLGLAVDILLSVFFCALFMQIFARARVRQEELRDGAVSPGKYLVAMLFATDWFPKLSAEALNSASGVLDEVFKRLKAWARGYGTVIVIEAPLYVTLFSLAGVPYALPLGILASCALLIPIVLPAVVIILTLLVTLTAPGVTLLQFLAVVAILGGIMFGLEMLFLYPKLVGGALGLTLLETVATVLLGGYLFGVPGLLLAVPTVSVLKYLFPQIWKCWTERFKPRLEAEKIS